MRTIETRRTVPHSAAEMLALVGDVGRYPEFVPMCEGMVIRERKVAKDVETILCDMTVGYQLFRETFTSRVRVDRPGSKVLVDYLDGPFRHLENTWTFTDQGAGACEVHFYLEYELKSLALQLIVGSVFDKAFAKLTEAFETRADVVYGKKKVAAKAKVAKRKLA